MIEEHYIRGEHFIVDSEIEPGDWIYSAADRSFHVGPGTDCHSIVFKMRLTRWDEKFLRALRVKP